MKSITYFVKLDNVRVPNYLEDVDFPGDSLDIRLVFDLVFFKDFDSYFLTSDEVSTEPNFSECSLSK